MSKHPLFIAALAVLTMPVLMAKVEARPTEIRITTEYKLVSNPAHHVVEIRGEEALSPSVDRKEVPVHSGGLAGALEGVATAIDTSGYTKVGTITRDGKRYDVYERADAPGKVTGVARIHIFTRPTAGGIEISVGPDDIHGTVDRPRTPEVIAKEQSLIGKLGERALAVKRDLDGFYAFSDDEAERLFGFEPATVTKTISYRVDGAPAELTVTVRSEIRKIIDAPLGEDP